MFSFFPGNKRQQKRVNLVLGGGGIKGLAYTGVFKVAEEMGISFANLAGVSAGSIAGSFAAAGLTADEMHNIMYNFDFGKIDITRLADRIPAISRYRELLNEIGIREHDGLYRMPPAGEFRNFVTNRYDNDYSVDVEDSKLSDCRCDFFKKLLILIKEGYLYNGDHVEEWVANTLASKGIRTFADLRGGVADKANPNGYKVRMTGVDVERMKIVMMPDEMIFYGIEPDNFEVAKAVKISTCVPFVFKPVEIKTKESVASDSKASDNRVSDNKSKVYHLIDGGVLDAVPLWAVEAGGRTPAAAFTLDGGEKGKFFSLDTPLSIFKFIVSAIHETGVPKEQLMKFKFIEAINTSKIGFLDFAVPSEDKDYLYIAGRKAAQKLFPMIK